MQKSGNKNGQVNWTGILRLALVLIALHSLVVGIVLMVIPAEFLTLFGFAGISERFFPAQGGIFHVVMSVAYTMGAYRPHRFDGLIVFSIIAKAIATVFLLVYFLFVDPIWMVLLSGIGDGLMAVLLLALFRQYQRSEFMKREI